MPQGLGAVQAPERLRNLNYIYFFTAIGFPLTPGSGTGWRGWWRGSGYRPRLARTSRYQQRAQEWADGARGEARLPSGTTSGSQRNGQANDPPRRRSSPLQLEFIRASEEAAAAQTDTRRKELEAIAAAQAERALALEQASGAEGRRMQYAGARGSGILWSSPVSVLALVAAMPRGTRQTSHKRAKA